MGGGDARLDDVRGSDPKGFPEARKALFEGFGRDAQVHQRSQGHVSGDADEAVDVQMTQVASSLLHMLAKTPAPNPLSILTTATPVEQVLSIPNREAKPPKEAP